MSNLENIVESVLNSQKIQIRKTIDRFSDKVKTEDTKAGNKTARMAINSVFNSAYMANTRVIRQLAEKWLQQTKEELPARLLNEFIDKAVAEKNDLLKACTDDLSGINANLKVLEEKEKSMVGKIDKLNQRLLRIKHPPFWHYLLFFKRKTMDIHTYRSLNCELILGHGLLTYIRLQLYAEKEKMQTLERYREFLNTKIEGMIKEIDGTLAQTENILDISINEAESHLIPDKGYQQDIKVREKLAGILSRISDQLVDSVARKLQIISQALEPTKVIDTAGEILEVQFSDIPAITASNRLKECYNNLGSYFVDLVQNEASPLLPLNGDSLLDDKPISKAAIGLSDEETGAQINHAIEESVPEHSFSIDHIDDDDKIILLSSIHRIPVFALSNIDKYQKALEAKEREYAVYAERRFNEYDSLTPRREDKSINELIILGLANNEIVNSGRGWYRVNGYKVHGIGKLRTCVAGDTKIINRIKDGWLDLFQKEGISGVIKGLSTFDSSEYTEEIRQTMKTIINRLTTINESNLTEERLLQVLMS